MSSGSQKDRASEHIDNGSGEIVNKPKRVALFRFRNVKNRLQKRKDKVFNTNSVSVGCLGKRVSGTGVGGRCCLLCLKNKPGLGSPGESRISDPSSCEFTHESLRGLIETNDFYSKECNCHVID